MKWYLQDYSIHTLLVEKWRSEQNKTNNYTISNTEIAEKKHINRVLTLDLIVYENQVLGTMELKPRNPYILSLWDLHGRLMELVNEETHSN